MLLTMRAATQAARAICYATALAIDRSERESDAAVRQQAHAQASLLTPVAKAFSTDIGNEVASLGIQVHGGMGYIEETGAAQLFRDARIAAIYEGTNGIQAIDLVTRKLPLGDGAAVKSHLEDLRGVVGALDASNDPGFGWAAVRLGAAVESLARTTDWLMARLAKEPEGVLAGASPYLRLFGFATGGCLFGEAGAGSPAAWRGRERAARNHAVLCRKYRRGRRRARTDRCRRRVRRDRRGRRARIAIEWLRAAPKTPYASAKASHFLDLRDVHPSHHPPRLSRTSHAARPSGTAGPAARHGAVVEAEKFQTLARVQAPIAPIEAIALCHPMDYITAVREAGPKEGLIHLDADTAMSPGTFEAALRAAGGAIHAVDEVLTKKAANAFVAARPPGHHAETARPMGFCLFDNAAIAARYAQRHYGIGRAAIVDFDVHHGNGSQEIFWSDKTVMYCSTHQMPLFPGTGAVGETGDHNTVVNAPLRPGDGAEAFRAAFESRILPRLAEFGRSLSSSPPASMPTCATRSPISISRRGISSGRRKRSWTSPIATPAAASSRCLRAVTICRRSVIRLPPTSPR